MRIALVYPPIPKVTTSIAPPVGLAYLASILVKKGAEVSVVSSDAEGLSVESTILRAFKLEPDMLGLSISTPTVNNALRIVSGVKNKRNKTVIFAGGPHPTLFPEEFLLQGVDFVVRGEGEETISDLYDFQAGKKSLNDIAGISYRKAGRIINNPIRPLIEDLDTLPFPSWELFPVKNYRSDFRKKEFSLPVLSSRGCPAQCTFCYKGIFGDKFRVRKPVHIVEEIEHLKNKFHVEEFAIIDDSFTSKPKRAMEVCDLIILKNIGLPWTLPAGIRVPTVSKELVSKLKAAGCYRVGLGIESGNQKILNSIKKGITLDQAKKAIKFLKEERIESAAYFMIGNLEETEETMDQTINFAIELNPNYAQFTKATPYPGTEMYNTLKAQDRIIASSWDDYDSFLKSKPIFQHNNLSPGKIDDKLREAYRRFYCRSVEISKHLKAINSPREVLNFVKNAIKFFRVYFA